MKKIIFLLLLATNSFVQTFAQNLVNNGSFSTTGGVGWGFFAPGTSVEAYITEAGYGGISATNITAEIDVEANLRQANIPVTPGQAYAISFKHCRRTTAGPGYPLPPIPSTINVKVYNGTNVFLTQNISSSNTTWIWQCAAFVFTPTTATITLDFENINNPSTLGMILDDITISPVTQAITFSGTPCQGGDITLTAPVSNPPDAVYTNYNWTGPNGYTATGNSITLSNVQPTQSGVYTCTMLLNDCATLSSTYTVTINPNTFNRSASICQGEVYNFYDRILQSGGIYDTLIHPVSGCDSNIILNLTMNTLPNVSLNKEGKISMCEGGQDVLKVVAESGNTYQWLQNNNPIPGATTDSLKVSTTGNYSVRVTNNKGCIATSNVIMLHIIPKPTITLAVIGNRNFCTMDTVRLKATATGENLEYSWTPDRYFHATSTNQYNEVWAVVPQSGYVTVTVYSGNICSAKDSVYINVHPCCDIGMPNAFTPNGDGKNDYFKPVLQVGQTIVSFRIFNRLGQIVYDNKNNQNKGWDGTFKGVKQSNDVYMYQLNYNCSDGKNYQKKGDITIIR
ncbi:gliding motility-associated C-terminal domain-containing protein [Taibaiella sp. KBW10]|uniref:T9SS type B sorting domain-containing protein n=1 Tax=Taibaiella sp. KBW10 TaxID=2153357 RepID=UPI0013152E8B|nr:gliding motility-associated C-terminal domain-containing protein [Taibaiella sp. KBW10]